MIGAKIFLNDRKSYSQFFRYRTAGFSLMEVLVSVSVFIVLLISATQIFKLVIDGQRSAIATQNVQESLKYFLEVISKEIRTAQINKSGGEICGGVPNGAIFLTTGPDLYFRNYYGQCVVYGTPSYGDTQQFQVFRDGLVGFISPRSVKIDSLRFVVDQSPDTQPTVTIKIDAWALKQGKFDSEIKIQTSVTSRQYR